MTPYISLFILSCLSTYLFNIESKYRNVFFFMIFSFIFFFCAFRYNVGGDWKRYLYLFDNNNIFLKGLFLKKDSIFFFLSNFSKLIIKNIFFNNLIISIIFFLSILPFLISKKNPALSLTIFLPLGVFILHMGFIRQSLALSLIILSIYLYEQKFFYKSFFFIILSIGFHFSAILFLFVILFHYINVKVKYKNFILLAVTVNLLIIFFIISNYFYNINFVIISFAQDYLYSFKLIQSYIIHNESISPGLFYRLIPTLLSIFFMLIFFNEEYETDCWILFFYLLILSIFLCICFGFFTLADRINYYTLPFQIMIFLFVMEKINDPFIKNLYIYSLELFYLSILIIWLLFSNFSKDNWQIYTTIF